MTPPSTRPPLQLKPSDAELLTKAKRSGRKDGVTVTLVEQAALDVSGILRAGQGCERAYGLPEESVQLFLLIAATPAGLPASRVPPHLREELAAHLVPLELQHLVEWQRDKQGKPAWLILTWRGHEALAAARPNQCRKNVRRRIENEG